MKKQPKKPSLSQPVIEDDQSAHDDAYNYFIEAATLLDPEWMDDAACNELNIYDFFPASNYVSDPSMHVAKTCQACPVRKECFETIAAMEAGRWSSKGQTGRGFFAGLNPSARSAIYHQPKKQWFELATRKLDTFIILQQGIDARREKRLATVGKPKGRPKKGAN